MRVGDVINALKKYDANLEVVLEFENLSDGDDKDDTGYFACEVIEKVTNVINENKSETLINIAHVQ